MVPHFPKPKYGFTKYLKRLGDFVETFPMTWEDAIKFNKAAHFWAWHHKKRVSVIWMPRKDGTYTMRATLTAYHRIRDFD